jgi:hypothetical protein
VVTNGALNGFCYIAELAQSRSLVRVGVRRMAAAEFSAMRSEILVKLVMPQKMIELRSTQPSFLRIAANSSSGRKRALSVKFENSGDWLHLDNAAP